MRTYLSREERSRRHFRGAKSLSVLRARLIVVELIDNYTVEHDAWKVWAAGNDETGENAMTRSSRRKTDAPRCPLDSYTDILYWR